MINTKLIINAVTYDDSIQIQLDRSSSDFNTTSSFIIEFNNTNGQYDDTFSLNEDVEIYADLDTDPAVTQIFLGVIENIQFKGKNQEEKVILTGRDYGAILQDLIVSPRIFKDTDAGDIIKALIIQNANGTGITTNNVNSVGTVVDRITFNNISLFDAFRELAELEGFYFYVDSDKDLHFEQRASTASGVTFDNTNITNADFKNTDSNIFNSVIVYGDRQLTGVRETFGAQAGSIYTLDDKPSNVIFTGSASTNVPIQPGGILFVGDPKTESVQFLVDYQASQVVLTSGDTAGDNTGWTGSSVIIDYQRSSPLIAIRNDATSISVYGKKDKIIIDRNVKSQDEANLKANGFLAEHKDPSIMGKINVEGIINLTPGNTAVVNIPFHNITNQTYNILNVSYVFNKDNNLSNQVLKVSVNKRIRDFIDYMKEQELRLRRLEGSEVDTSITNFEVNTGSVMVETSYNAISRSIGSAFYFHIPGHDILNSDTSLIGDMRAGSEVKSG